MNEVKAYGVMARFETADGLLAATQAARSAGYRRMDAYAPFPIAGLSEALGRQRNRIALIALVSGLMVSSIAFFIQWYAAIDYPVVVGGKPLNSWPAFMPVTFEMGILAGVLAAIIAMLAGNGLPRPYHPVFNWPEFDRASGDGFFLLIRDDDVAAVTAFLRQQQPAAVQELHK